MKAYEYLPHTADVRFRAYGKTLEKVFENCAIATFNIMVDTKNVKAKTIRSIAAEGADLQALLQHFLEQFIILIDTDNFFLSKIRKIVIKKRKGKYVLTAVAVGDEAKNYETLGPLVKAITYNEMIVRQEGKQWVAQVLVDI